MACDVAAPTLTPTSVVSATAGVWSSLCHLPVWLRDPCGGKCRPAAATTVRWPAAKGLLLRAVPGQQRSRSAPSFSQAPRSLRAAAGIGYRAAPVPSPIHIRPDSAVDQIQAGGLTDRSPYASPHRRTRVCHSGGQGRTAATPVHLPNSPRHHAETSVAGRRPRTGRYECRHHSRPTVVAGVNNRRSEIVRVKDNVSAYSGA